MELDVARGVETALLILTALILVGPVIAERVRLPGLVGLIFLGVVFGPSGLAWLVEGGLVATVGALGLLYLMFLAGIELDVNGFLENRGASITFGLLTFAVPFAASFSVAWLSLDYSFAAAALVGAMWASHTLVAYPEVKVAGLESTRTVGTAVSATVITDILALFVLGVTASSAETAETGASDAEVMPLWLGIVVLVFFCLWVLPRVADWFFTSVGHTRTERFIFCLAGMAAGAVVGLLGGIEGLVGAFLAGIGLNRQVPARGGLMEHIEFFGGALFVPAFLISVGLSIDPRSLLHASTLQLALIFIALVIVTKTLVALASGRIFGFSLAESGLLASLTIGQAAATLAIARVGVDVGILTQQILDASVVTVVLTVLVTSLGTRSFARRIGEPTDDETRLGSHVLLDASEAGVRRELLQVAVAIARADDGLVTPFVIITDADEEVMEEALATAVEEAAEVGSDSDGVRRFADTRLDGVLDLSEELDATLLLIPWSGPRSRFGEVGKNTVDAIGSASRVPVAAVHLTNAKWERVVVVTGHSRARATRDSDIALAVEIGRRVATRLELDVVVYTRDHGIEADSLDVTEVRPYKSGAVPWAEVGPNDIVVIPSFVMGGSVAARRRMRRSLTGKSLLVVGGPGRLRVASATDHDALAGVVGRTRPRMVGRSTTRISRSGDRHDEGDEG